MKWDKGKLSITINPLTNEMNILSNTYQLVELMSIFRVIGGDFLPIHDCSLRGSYIRVKPQCTCSLIMTKCPAFASYASHVFTCIIFADPENFVVGKGGRVNDFCLDVFPRGPNGPSPRCNRTLTRAGSVPVFLRKPMATCDFTWGVRTPRSPSVPAHALPITEPVAKLTCSWFYNMTVWYFTLLLITQSRKSIRTLD